MLARDNDFRRYRVARDPDLVKARVISVNE